MDLRSTSAALWILALLLALQALPERVEVPPSDCPDAERREVREADGRRSLALLLCPEEVGDRDASLPRGAAGLLLGRPIDLNEATVEELQALPGIGPGLARRIAEDRARRGPFGAPEELVRVRGLGPVRASALEGLVRASPER